MGVQWDDLFVFTISPWELVIRGTLVYWFIFILLRLAGRRDLGSFGAADVLLVVLIADAAQNAMSSDYNSVAEGMVLVGTLVFWSVAIDRGCYYLPALDRLLKPARVCLVKDGVIQRRGMRREYVTRDELMSEIQQQGVADLKDIWRAYMEPTGDISLLKTSERPDAGRKQKKGAPGA